MIYGRFNEAELFKREYMYGADYPFLEYAGKTWKITELVKTMLGFANYQAEEVDPEHPANVLRLALFDCGEVADPGVVHQDVDAAEVFLGMTHGIGDLGWVGHIQSQNQGPILDTSDKVFHLFRVAGRHHRTVSAGKHDPGQLTAEAARTAGNEPRQ